jgi:hypothetical protein
MTTDAEIFDMYDADEKKILNADIALSIYNGADMCTNTYVRATADVLEDTMSFPDNAAISYAQDMKEERPKFARIYSFLERFAEQKDEGYTSQEMTQRTWDEEQNFDELASLESLAQKK